MIYPVSEKPGYVTERLLALSCRRMIPQMFEFEERYDEARRYNEEAMRNSPFAGERIMAEIDNLEMEQHLNHRRNANARGLRMVNDQRIHYLLKGLEQVDYVGEPIIIPKNLELGNAYPNPFNSATTISYALPKEAQVNLKIYDVSGRQVVSLVDKVQKSGNYTISWNAIDIPSGVYFCRLDVNNKQKMIKLALVR